MNKKTNLMWVFGKLKTKRIQKPLPRDGTIVDCRNTHRREDQMYFDDCELLTDCMTKRK